VVEHNMKSMVNTIWSCGNTMESIMPEHQSHALMIPPKTAQSAKHTTANQISARTFLANRDADRYRVVHSSYLGKLIFEHPRQIKSKC